MLRITGKPHNLTSSEDLKTGVKIHFGTGTRRPLTALLPIRSTTSLNVKCREEAAAAFRVTMKPFQNKP